jgi:hypothetical protein
MAFVAASFLVLSYFLILNENENVKVDQAAEAST